jgi:hypothetical protein
MRTTADSLQRADFLAAPASPWPTLYRRATELAAVYTGVDRCDASEGESLRWDRARGEATGCSDHSERNVAIDRRE